MVSRLPSRLPLPPSLFPLPSSPFPLPAFLFPLTLLSFLAAPTSAFAHRSVYIEDLTWPEVQQAIASGKTSAIIYTGSTEQNGPHMAIGKHNFIARWVAGAIAIKLGDALVDPTLAFAPTGDPVARTAPMRFR